jgi:hypothetical protein
MSIFENATVPGSLTTELANRAKTSVNLWNASKAAWVHVMSMADTCARGPIASNGNYIYTANYERPQPNVKSVKVTKQGELGTTRKCTLELQAWTDDQLNEIAKCYFLPGMSARVQFGWSVNAAGSPGTTPVTAVYTDSEAYCKIFDKASSEACYDGFQGKVANYNYSLNEDNGWDITIEIISAANFVAETKMDSTNNNCECTAKVGDSKVPLNNTNLMQSVLNTLATPEAAKALIASLGLSSNNFCRIAYEGAQRTSFGEEATNFMAWLAGVTGTNVEENFISVRALHTMINKFALPEVFGKVDTTGVKLKTKNIEYVFSSDIRICYVPGGTYSNKLIQGVKVGSPPSAISGEFLILDNVMINTVYLMKVLKEMSSQSDGEKGLSLQRLLQTIHTTINSKLGNFWSLEILDATGKCEGDKIPVIQILDTATAETTSTVTIEPTKSGQTSITRDIKLETKLTDSMKSMALYAYVPNQGNSDPCIGKFTAFRQNKAKNRAEPKAATTKTKGASIPCTFENKDMKCEEKADPVTKFNEALKKVQDEITEDGVTALETARSEILATLNTEAQCDTILPFEFSFTLDGIGGFKFGQYVNHPRIPEGIRNVWKFQVTTVEHEISDNNDWKTTVNTVARYKSK